MTSFINCYTRRIHVTSNIILRSMTFRSSSNDVRHLCVNNKLDSSLKNQNNSDYFGIDSEEGVITVGTQKHSSLETNRKRSVKEKFHNTAFGVVRYDSENKLRYHGQYNSRRDFIFPYKSSEMAEVQKDLLSSTVDCENQLEDELNAFPSREKNIINNSIDILKEKEEGVGYIDEYYFGTSVMNSSNVDDAKQSEPKDLSFIDQEYFKTLDNSFSSSGDIRDFPGKIAKDSSKVEEIYHSSPTYESAADDLNFLDKKMSSESETSIDKKASTNAEHSEPKDLSFIDQEYFKTCDDSCNSSDDSRDFSRKIMKDSSKLEEIYHSPLTYEKAADDLNFFDQNYFQNFITSENEASINEKAFVGKNDLSELSPSERNSTVERKDKSGLNKLSSSFNEYNFSSTDINNINKNLNDSQNIFIQDSAPSSEIINESISKNTLSEKPNPEELMNKTLTFKDEDLFKGHETNTRHDYDFSEGVNTFSRKINFKYPMSSEKAKKNAKKLKEVFQSVAPDTENSSEVHVKAIKSFSKENNDKYSGNIPEESEQDSVQSAHDFVQGVRKEQKNSLPNLVKRKGISEEKTDSKGFRILKNQVQDLSNFTQAEILHILKQNIVYSDENLLVLNKPYSLVIHESETTKKPCLSMVLDELAKEMDKNTPNPKLFTVHRLDKETTGCLLLARNETMAQNLKYLFAERKIIKKYWIITTKVPDPTEGVIDMPITEGSINNRKRMVLSPKLPKDLPYRNHSRGGKPAITSYQVISESGNAALVEAMPVTGVKHQIRVHFGFGLGCPILGDHKYSHLDKLAPQKLPTDMLQRLHVRQSKVRYIPMHIHAKSVIIPSYFERRDLIVHIPLPDHMKDNLKRLKFKKK